jgi:hypothetical protein
MDGCTLLPFVVLALLGTSATADSPSKLSPVLPEVTKHLQEGFADVERNTPLMARANAELILLENEVRYRVSFEGVPERRRKDCVKALHSAISEWEQALGEPTLFLQSPPDGKIVLLIHFRPKVTMCREQVAGYVNWSRVLDTEANGGVLPKFSADLQLRVRDLSGRDMPLNAMRHAALHELGHVLGLDDSPNEGDVMGPLDVENPVFAPTSLEIQTVRSLRAEANEILDKAATGATK